jgi:hypothetical protein
MMTSFGLVTTVSLSENLTIFFSKKGQSSGTAYIIILIMCDKRWLPEKIIMVDDMKYKGLRGVS